MFANSRFGSQKWVLLLVVIVSVVAHLSGVTDWLSFDSLKEHRRMLTELTQKHSIIAPLGFMILYAVLVTLALPGATVLTLASGFLFKQPFATIFAVIGAATGACGNYYLSTCAFGNRTRRLVQEWKGGGRIEQGLRENEAIFMMLLRLVPIFPFWFVNIAPSVLGVKFSTFAWTTYLGIIPGSYVYTQCGYGLATAMDADLKQETLSSFLVKGIFNQHTAGGFAFLGLWLCFLLTLRWWVNRNKKRDNIVLDQQKIKKSNKKKENVSSTSESDSELYDESDSTSSSEENLNENDNNDGTELQEHYYYPLNMNNYLESSTKTI